MRWGDMRPSDNVEHAGSGGRFPMGGGGIRLGGIGIVVVVILSLVFGVNPLALLGMMEGGGTVATSPAPQAPTAPSQSAATKAAQDPTFDFVRRVTGDTEDVWTALMKQMGQRYEPPRLRTFERSTYSQCGPATAASGPFYCPADRTIYLDTSFFQELAKRFGAPGDFAAAYVIAHEVGHHVQNQLGTMEKFEATAQRDPRARNAMSVRLELQADCYAGVWGYYAAKRNLLEPGDAEEGLRAAAAVGDDNITKGRVSPDAFTHGTSEQRMRWFRQGMTSGDPRTCNTFAARE